MNGETDADLWFLLMLCALPVILLSSQQLEAGDTEDLRNVAVEGTATSPDGHQPDQGGKSAWAAIDGDSSTYWDEEDDQDQYRLLVTLNRPYPISTLQISGYEHHDFAPKDFDVLLDGETVEEVRGAEYDDNSLQVSLSGQKARTVELSITGYYGGSPAVRELKILSPSTSTSSTSVGSGASEFVDPDALEWRHEQGQSIQLSGPQGPIWRFRYSDRFGKPHFDPMGPYNGPSLVWAMPDDHVWHYGAWFSWKLINGVNYWEENENTLKAKGRTSWSNVEVTTLFDGSARITMDLSYHEPGDELLLTERRTLMIGPPREDGSYIVDWRSEFKSTGQAVTLDRTPPPGVEGGKSYGGYAGLSIRYAKELANSRFVSTDGTTQVNGNARLKARAADLNGRIGDRTAGIAMIDHPSNPRHPTSWYGIVRNDSFSYLNAALIQPKPMTLSPDASLDLRYRMVVHNNRWNRERLNRAYGTFISQRGTSAAEGEGIKVVSERPRVFRVLLPDTSTRSMAVGTPFGPNVCFDAERCVLQYAWDGGFINVKPQVDGRGGKEVKLLGQRFPVGAHHAPFRFADATTEPEFNYRQYKIQEDGVTFRFSVDGYSVRQTVSATPDGLGVQSHYRFESTPDSDLLLERNRDRTSIRASSGEWDEHTLRIPASQATSFTLSIRPN